MGFKTTSFNRTIMEEATTWLIKGKKSALEGRKATARFVILQSAVLQMWRFLEPLLTNNTPSHVVATKLMELVAIMIACKSHLC